MTIVKIRTKHNLKTQCLELWVIFCFRRHINHSRNFTEEHKLKPHRDLFGHWTQFIRIKQLNRPDLLDFSCFYMLLALPIFPPTSELLTSGLLGDGKRRRASSQPV